jgi:CIC family chloride channel protein
MSLRDLQRWFVESHHHGALVLNDRGRLSGVITLQDLERAIHNNVDRWHDLEVQTVMTRNLLVAYRDEPIGAALQRLGLRDVGRLAVVDREEPDILLGVIRRHDIARAYQTGVFRRMDAQNRVTHVSMTQESGATAVELVVRPGSAAAGTPVRELDLPRGVLLTTRRHGGRRTLLHGDDVLAVNDVIFALAEPDQVEELERLFRPLQNGGERG